MSDEWRTDEPEQGQLAQIIDEQGETHFALGHNGNGLNEFGWETHSGWLDFHQVQKWLPLRTPEENRLRDLCHWREWPEETPDKKGKYLVCTDGSTDIGVHVSYWSDSIGWSTKDAGIRWWRPIGPLPCE